MDAILAVAFLFGPPVVSLLATIPLKFEDKPMMIFFSAIPLIGLGPSTLAVHMFIFEYFIPVYVSKKPFKFYSREVADNIFSEAWNYQKKEKAIKHLSRKDYKEFLKYLKASVRYGEARTEIGDAFYRKGFDNYQRDTSEGSSIKKIKAEQVFSSVKLPD